MGAVGVLRIVEGGQLAFRCPGCGDMHVVPVGAGAGPRWGWNGSYERPTFTPSILVRSGHYAPGHVGECWCTWEAKSGEKNFGCYVCHSFVTDGSIQFLPDCTHELAGQTVPLRGEA